MSYQYSEPKEAPEFEPLPEGDYPFEVKEVLPTYTNENGNFVLPVSITLKDTTRNIKQWLSAGTSVKGKPFDMIAPFLKCIRRNPAIGEEPDFSSRNLVGATGIAHVSEKPYTGKDAKYKDKMFPGVDEWIYDREKTNATVSGGKDAKDRTYGKLPSEQKGSLKPVDPLDEVPF